MANILEKGAKFNKLVFIENLPKRSKDNHLIGKFICDCGRRKEITISRVVNGYTKSCGDKIHFKGINKKHGGRHTKEYAIWITMKDRVFNKNNKDYLKYSKLGMSKKLASNFQEFLNEVGVRPNENMSIDRIDNRRGYFEGNMRWTTRNEQQSNKSTSVIVSIRGKKFGSYSEAGRYFGVSLQTVRMWCVGGIDKRRLNQRNRGVINKRSDCSATLKY